MKQYRKPEVQVHFFDMTDTLQATSIPCRKTAADVLDAPHSMQNKKRTDFQRSRETRDIGHGQTGRGKQG